jgi:hypothetical protein
MSNAAELLAKFANLPIGSGVNNWRVDRTLADQEYEQAAAEEANVNIGAPPIIDTNPLSSALSKAAGRQSYQADRNSYQTSSEAVTDTALSAISGLTQTVGGLIGLGAGINSDRGGAAVAEFMAELNQEAQDMKSAGQNNRARASESRSRATSLSDVGLYKTDQQNRSPFVAGLRRIGREAITAVSNATVDPVLLTDGAANAVGSLVVGGAVGKGAKVASLGLTSKLLKGGIISEGAALKAAGMVEKLAMPGTIGSMEAGGAYNQTVQSVMEMSHEDLMLTSKDYADLIAQKWSREDAKIELATSAGLTAAAIQFPVAVAAGTLVSKFEANPFKGAGSMLNVFKNVGKEAIEEGIQSGSAEFAGNVGKRLFVDSGQDFTDGVGEQAGLGALYGSMSAGGIQAPGAALETVSSVTNAAGNAVKSAATGLVQKGKDRVIAINEAIKNASPVSTDNIRASVETVIAEAPAVMEELDRDIAEQKIAPDQGNVIKERLGKLTNTIAFDPTELADLNMSDEMKAFLGESTNRFDALDRASRVAASTDVDPVSRMEAALFINDSLNSVGATMIDDLVSAMEPMENDHPSLGKLREYENVLTNFQTNPELQIARQQAQKYVDSLKASDISEQNITAPKGQLAVKGMASVAMSNPELVDGELADLVLEHSRSGRIKLSASQTRALVSSSNLRKAGLTYTLKAKKLALPERKLTPTEIVGKQILDAETENSVVEKSAAGHVRAVNEAMQSGNLSVASDRLQSMMAFAQHMQNKLAALNQSYQSGTGSAQSLTKYQALMPNRNWQESLTGVWLNPKAPGSIVLAQRISLEAQTIGELANQLAASMPELGVKPIALGSLVPELDGPAPEIARKFQKGLLSVEQATEPTPTPIPTPTPVVEPVVATEPVKADPVVKAQPSTQVKAENKAPEAAVEAPVVQEPITKETPADSVPEEQFLAPPEIVTTQPEAKVEPAKTKLEGYANTIRENTGEGWTFSEFSDEDAKAVRDEAANILGAHGLNIDDVADDFVLFESKEDIGLAYAFYDVPVIAFARETLPRLKRTAGALARVLSHELGHLIDQKIGVPWNKNGLRSSSDSFNETGKLYQEFATLKNNTALAKMQKPRWSYMEFHLREGNNSEFFAEAVSFVMLNPALAKELVPNVYAEIGKAIAQAGGKISEEALGTPGSESVPVGRVGERVEPETIEQAFPNLVTPDNGKFINWFHRSFQLPKTVRSRLLGTGNPLKLMIDALSSQEASDSFRGVKGTRTITTDLAAAYKSYLGQGNLIIDKMKARLAEKLGDALSKTNPTTFQQALLDGLESDSQVNGYRSGKSLNIVEQDTDGNLGYNEELMQGAVLAGLQWAISAQSIKRTYDAEDLAKLLNIDEAQAAQYVAWFNEGMWQEAGKRELAALIPKFWGLQANRDAPEGYVKGITETMAAEVLNGMMAAGLISQVSADIEGKTYTKFLFDPKKTEVFQALNKYPSAIEEAALVEPENINHIGKAPERVATNQLHGSPVPLKPKQTELIKNAQNTPHKLNLRMLRFMEILGESGIEGLFGRGSRTGSNTNDNTLKSIEGYNRTITSAFSNLKALVDEMNNYADTNNQDLADVEMFYEFGISSVGRLQMQGGANPQSSKVVREVMLPTWATLDLSDSAGPHYRAFMLAMAQHLGVKVHKKLEADSITQIEQELEGKFDDLMAIMEEWDSAYEDTPLELTAEDFAPFKKVLGEKVSPAAIHSLMEYARYQKASPEERAAFKTGLYLEADGVTDGPINALFNLVAGSFKASWIDLMNRGGMYLGGTRTSLADFISKKDSPFGNGTVKTDKDLYQLTTDFLKDTLAGLKGALQTKQSYTNINDAFTRVLADLLPDMHYNEETKELKFDRGISKSPLTVTVYGSGVGGIANKITALALEEMYLKYPTMEDMSDAMRQDIKFLTTFAMTKSKFGYKMVKDETVGPAMKSGLSYTFTPGMIKSLETNVRTLLAQPLQEAISEVMGDALQTAHTIRTATQAQSIFFKYAYRQAIADALKQKDGTDGVLAKDFLSAKELEGVFRKLLVRFPMVETDSQMIWVGGSARADIEAAEFGRDIQDKMISQPYVYGPSNAGVSGIPFIVIGTGDGQMIINALTGETPPQGTLPVFDGINMKLDTIMEDSEKINKAVYDGWMLNPVRAVEQSFKTFLEKGGMDQAQQDMSEEMLEELDRAFGPEAMSPTVELQAAYDRLAQIANSLDARKAVLARVNMSVDHMASAGSPYVKTGGVDLPADPVAAAAIMDEMYQEELAKLPKAEPLKVYLKPSEDIRSFMASNSEGHPSGAKLISRDKLRTLVDQLNIPLDQKSLVRAAANSLATKDWTVLHGSQSQLEDYANAEGIRLPAEWEANDGIALVGSKTIFLLSANSETLAHELIHAATLEQVYGHYTTKKAAKLTKDEVTRAEAIKRMEVLMDEFMGIDPATITDEKTQVEFGHAKAAIQKIDDSVLMSEPMKQTARLNEFMAWTLANQKLSDLARGTKVRSKLGLIVAKVMATLKKLWRAGLAPTAQDDVYSNLRFNTLLLMNAKPSKIGSSGDLASLAQYQSRGYGESDRISKLETDFINRMIGILKQAEQDDLMGSVKVKTEHAGMRVVAANVVRSAIGARFEMTHQEAALYETLVTAFAVDNTLDANAMSRLEEIYRHVLNQLDPKDFRKDPDTNDDADQFYAQQKYDFVVGKLFVGTDALNRSTLLGSFLALAAVSEEFQNILSGMTLPKAAKVEGGTLDEFLVSKAQATMDNLARKLSGEGSNNPDAKSATAAILRRLADSQTERESFIAQTLAPVGNAVDSANDWIISQMQRLSQQAADKAEETANNTDNKYVKMGANAAQALLGVVNQDVGEKNSRLAVSMLNEANAWTPLRELVSEVVGRTTENASIYDMIKAVRAFGQKLRQTYRDQLPPIFASKFSRKLSKEELTHMHSMAKVDLGVFGSNGIAQVLENLRDDKKLKANIANLEAEVAKLDSTHNALILTKAKELAAFMTTRKASSNLLRNAESVVSLFGEIPDGMRKRRGPPSTALIAAVDQLTSLYAMALVPTKTRIALSELAAKEADGMSFVLSYLANQRADEMAKSHTSTARLNQYKGYVPTEVSSGSSLIVADDKGYADLVTRGYTRVGAYKGSEAERGLGSKSYYFAPLTGKSPFNQGIAQNIRQTFSGVDPVTGLSLDMHGVGRITDQAKVRAIQASRSRNGNQTEALLPVFNTKGEIIAYERSMDPVQLERLEYETNLFKIMGIWRGRQVEEKSAIEINKELVRKLHDVWSKKDTGRENEYVNLLDKKSHNDPVIEDAVKLFTPEMLEEIKQVFGGDGFMVRKDMVNDAIGYRAASIGDVWTGVTRISPDTAKIAANIATAMFGPKAYQRFVTAEKLWQNFVGDARTTIVVRSMVVPMANLISNVYQLAARGVPLVNVSRGMISKLAEVRSYHANRILEVRLEAEILASKNNIVRSNALKAELRSIQDGHKRLTIWPLIAAGEFSSVSEATVDRENTTLFEGKMSEYIEGLVSKLPDEIQTAGRYAIVSRDTALFQGLQRAVEYGDFLAKAVLYDDLTKRKKMTSKEAMVTISDEFVNYDRLPGRFRGSLESNGLIWFWHFKLRSIKVAMSMIRNNPLHVLLASLVPTPDMIGSVGLPVTDNALAIMAEGKSSYSIGPAMGIHAQALNPWTNLLL